MGLLKILVPFLGGAVLAAAVGLKMQMDKDEDEKPKIEVDAEFVEKTDEESR